MKNENKADLNEITFADVAALPFNMKVPRAQTVHEHRAEMAAEQADPSSTFYGFPCKCRRCE